MSPNTFQIEYYCAIKFATVLDDHSKMLLICNLKYSMVFLEGELWLIYFVFLHLCSWAENRKEWKFQKTRQTWLLQHMFDSEKVNCPKTWVETLFIHLIRYWLCFLQTLFLRVIKPKPPKSNLRAPPVGRGCLSVLSVSFQLPINRHGFLCKYPPSLLWHPYLYFTWKRTYGLYNILIR